MTAVNKSGSGGLDPPIRRRMRPPDVGDVMRHPVKLGGVTGPPGEITSKMTPRCKTPANKVTLVGGQGARLIRINR